MVCSGPDRISRSLVSRSSPDIAASSWRLVGMMMSNVRASSSARSHTERPEQIAGRSTASTTRGAGARAPLMPNRLRLARFRLQRSARWSWLGRRRLAPTCQPTKAAAAARHATACSTPADKRPESLVHLDLVGGVAGRMVGNASVYAAMIPPGTAVACLARRLRLASGLSGGQSRRAWKRQSWPNHGWTLPARRDRSRLRRKAPSRRQCSRICG